MPELPKKPATVERPAREMRIGYIEDFISGLSIKATAEEIEAVQVFSRRLVEDYGYEKNLIQTRPQFRVRKRAHQIRRSRTQ